MNNNQRPCDGFQGNMGMPQAGTGLPTAVETMLHTGANMMPSNTGMLPNMLPNMLPAGKGTMPAGTGKLHSGTGMMPAGTSMLHQGASGGSAMAAPPAVATQPGWTTMPATLESTLFTPGFLRTQIGRRVRVEFLIGTNGTTDRSGTLLAVGASYIVIRPFESDDLMMCDLYAIKFVTIFL